MPQIVEGSNSESVVGNITVGDGSTHWCLPHAGLAQPLWLGALAMMHLSWLPSLPWCRWHQTVVSDSICTCWYCSSCKRGEVVTVVEEEGAAGGDWGRCHRGSVSGLCFKAVKLMKVVGEAQVVRKVGGSSFVVCDQPFPDRGRVTGWGLVESLWVQSFSFPHLLAKPVLCLSEFASHPATERHLLGWPQLSEVICAPASVTVITSAPVIFPLLRCFTAWTKLSATLTRMSNKSAGEAMQRASGDGAKHWVRKQNRANQHPKAVMSFGTQ